LIVDLLFQEMSGCAAASLAMLPSLLPSLLTSLGKERHPRQCVGTLLT
jgi:hypothetical protein